MTYPRRGEVQPRISYLKGENRMRNMVRLALAALAAMLLPAGLSAQGDGAVTGQVLDRNTQRPVADARVVVVGTQRIAVTDREGRYVVRGVPPGSYDVRAQRVGYTPGVQRVTVEAGASAMSNFGLGVSALL
ncbi:MAG TPA: carboxypeptidase regulatory-like domain-containing protein, partial [Gemmatimonadaceae bacterium]|nr:carboxypeptidase regulatory-like domain-containing protein [Gemmatimonadaceae bacterium]